ncbi:MAG: hypothetical protein M1813_002617 [Trichoglossum hirsutum]|nr:MAG: hypothetical protein M1813_002617 [Trichoglossum hirsutum]
MSGKENQQPLSIMARKFLMDAEGVHSQGLDPSNPCYAFYKKFYFFYGTLMDPATLAKVLSRSDQPVLRPAKIIGYRYMMWGPYPALIDDRSGGMVHGVAYEVQSPEEVELLKAYETRRYYDTGCSITLEDGTRVSGRTFKWYGKRDDLREGVFSLEDWVAGKLLECGSEVPK